MQKILAENKQYRVGDPVEGMSDEEINRAKEISATLDSPFYTVAEKEAAIGEVLDEIIEDPEAAQKKWSRLAAIGVISSSCAGLFNILRISYLAFSRLNATQHVSWGSAKQIFAEKLRNPFYGARPVAISEFFKRFIKFALQEFAEEFLSQNTGLGKVGLKAFSGVVAGLVDGFFMNVFGEHPNYALSQIKQKNGQPVFSSMQDYWRYLYKTDGAAILWKGSVHAAFRNAIWAGIFFPTQYVLEGKISQYTDENISRFASGFVAAISATVLTMANESARNIVLGQPFNPGLLDRGAMFKMLKESGKIPKSALSRLHGRVSLALLQKMMNSTHPQLYTKGSPPLGPMLRLAMTHRINPFSIEGMFFPGKKVGQQYLSACRESIKGFMAGPRSAFTIMTLLKCGNVGIAFALMVAGKEPLGNLLFSTQKTIREELPELSLGDSSRKLFWMEGEFCDMLENFEVAIEKNAQQPPVASSALDNSTPKAPDTPKKFDAETAFEASRYFSNF